MGEMIKTSVKLCKSCKYSMGLSGFSSDKNVACDYLGKTGNLRNCKVGECDKYEKKEKRKINKFL